MCVFVCVTADRWLHEFKSPSLYPATCRAQRAKVLPMRYIVYRLFRMVGHATERKIATRVIVMSKTRRSSLYTLRIVHNGDCGATNM